ncbi:CubicO group peptidase (beta-lactamase class C family) [Curtobacterium flaccumfaciens]|uniref:CubicO group peptidase (Beta-lactamase class C family) n=1 Tax=Curtobacterium salicis TaxID=1779862 RepID=A0ABX0T8Z3_9MICO|nr:serine hydrolase domain-containing protein [Curtobacterium sp. WW7]NII41987.1 CubicO group peptidase (beta-lactamase class C family) [Curtobacterium sp. WW7]
MTRPSSAAIDAVDALHRQRVADGIAPSSVWGVFDRDGLVASGGAGDRGDGTAPDADTVYRIASCTKSVTATALLGLVADGLLSLDAPVTDFVPAFRSVALPTADSPVPSVRMLLTMSAGFPTDDPWGDRQENISDDDLDDVLRAGLLFDSVPGTRFAYSNLGYALLGRVVAVAAGAPFTTVATERVLRPLGLDDTVFAAADARGHVVTGHRRHGSDWEALTTPGPGAFSPIGGLFSTVRDLARWGSWLAAAFDGTTPPFPTRTAPPGSSAVVAAPVPLDTTGRRAMQQAMRMVPGEAMPGSSRATGYGFGLFVEHDPVVGSIVSHSGGYPGFSAHMRWSASRGIGVVAFENATQAKVSVAATRAHDLVLTDVLSAGGESITVGSADLPSGPAPTLPAPAVAASPVLPETRAAQHAVRRLLADWDDDRAALVCTPNVPLDVPWDRRRAALAAAVDAVGADLGADPVAEESGTPTHLRWWLPGERSRLRVEIRLAPLAAGLVQTLTVRAEPTPA